jgi:hypothetical protein
MQLQSPSFFSLTGLVTVVLVTSMALLHAAGSAQPLRVGDPLPDLRGDYLTGRSVTLPADSAGKATLILMGFTYASRLPVEAWGDWFRHAVGVGPAATFFEVPMIGGFGKLGRWFIDRGMRKGTPAELHENVITVYANTGDWKRRLGVSDSNDTDAFAIAVDRQGVVRWLSHGPFDQARADEVKSLLTKGHP